MAERSFAGEVEKLRLGDGGEMHGEGILAVTKALLQSGVSYIGGYQGSPISHLIDVFNDARDILEELGVHFEQSASEAAAASMLAASINYPMRGAVAWKSTVGTNVASDALANVASAGVKGGALVIVGEDYGEGASIMQERSHSFAMKSQVWLLDPRPDLDSIAEAVEQGFELSEASNSPGDAAASGACLPRTRGAEHQGQQASRLFRGRCPRCPGPGRAAHCAAPVQLSARSGKGGAALACCRGVHSRTGAQRGAGRRAGRSWHHRARRPLQHPEPGHGARGLLRCVRQCRRARLCHERGLPSD